MDDFIWDPGTTAGPVMSPHILSRNRRSSVERDANVHDSPVGHAILDPRVDSFSPLDHAKWATCSGCCISRAY
jgi:hypothetical protein